MFYLLSVLYLDEGQKKKYKFMQHSTLDRSALEEQNRFKSYT